MKKWTGFIILSLLFIIGLLAVGIPSAPENQVATETAEKVQSQVLSIALVNEDQGVEVDGQEYNLGQSYIRYIERDEENDWHVLNRGVADSGFNQGNYQLYITIPHDFSEMILNIDETDPESLQLNYKINAGEDGILEARAREMGEQVMSELNQRLVDIYVATILDNLHTAQQNVLTMVNGYSSSRVQFEQDVYTPAISFQDRIPGIVQISEAGLQQNGQLTETLQGFTTNTLQNFIESQRNFSGSLEDLLTLRQEGRLTYEEFLSALLEMNEQLLNEQVDSLLTQLTLSSNWLGSEMNSSTHSNGEATFLSLKDELDLQIQEQLAQIAEIEREIERKSQEINGLYGDRVYDYFDIESNEEITLRDALALYSPSTIDDIQEASDAINQTQKNQYNRLVDRAQHIPFSSERSWKLFVNNAPNNNTLNDLNDFIIENSFYNTLDTFEMGNEEFEDDLEEAVERLYSAEEAFYESERSFMIGDLSGYGSGQFTIESPDNISLVAYRINGGTRREFGSDSDYITVENPSSLEVFYTIESENTEGIVVRYTQEDIITEIEPPEEDANEEEDNEENNGDDDENNEETDDALEEEEEEDVEENPEDLLEDENDDVVFKKGETRALNLIPKQGNQKVTVSSHYSQNREVALLPNLNQSYEQYDLQTKWTVYTETLEQDRGFRQAQADYQMLIDQMSQLFNETFIRFELYDEIDQDAYQVLSYVLDTNLSDTYFGLMTHLMEPAIEEQRQMVFNIQDRADEVYAQNDYLSERLTLVQETNIALQESVQQQIEVVNDWRADFNTLLSEESNVRSLQELSDQYLEGNVDQLSQIIENSQVVRETSEQNADQAQDIYSVFEEFDQEVEQAQLNSAVLARNAENMLGVLDDEVAGNMDFAEDFQSVMSNAQQGGIINEPFMRFLSQPLQGQAEVVLESSQIQMAFVWVIVLFSISLVVAHIVQSQQLFALMTDAFMKKPSQVTTNLYRVIGLSVLSLLFGLFIGFLGMNDLNIGGQSAVSWHLAIIAILLVATLFNHYFMKQFGTLGFVLSILLLVSYVLVSGITGSYGRYPAFSQGIRQIHLLSLFERLINPFFTNNQITGGIVGSFVLLIIVGIVLNCVIFKPDFLKKLSGNEETDTE